jgi:hypothetical protein
MMTSFNPRSVTQRRRRREPFQVNLFEFTLSFWRISLGAMIALIFQPVCHVWRAELPGGGWPRAQLAARPVLATFGIGENCARRTLSPP